MNTNQKKQNTWMNKSTSVYHIFLDRFSGYSSKTKGNHPEFCGGSIRGVIDKLEYIKSMAFNTVWLSPFYETSAYHGYHITDFDRVDERFGSLADLKELIKSCHNLGMRIIVDIVPNHCSQEHKWFKNALNNKNSKYRKWFYFDNSTNDYLKFLGFSVLPKLNLEHPEVEFYMIKSLVNWASLGFDGFRIDHVVGIPDKFLLKLKSELSKIKPGFILIGEAWSEGMKYKYLKTLRIKGKHKLWKKGFQQVDLQNHYDGIIDGVLDFGWRDLLVQSIQLIKKKKQAQLNRILEQYNKQCGKGLILPRFLDNHDTNRILHTCNQDEGIFKICLEILFEQPYPVVIYYGTEYGLSHQEPVSPDISFSDLSARSVIDWNKSPRFKDLIIHYNNMRVSSDI
jgi:glycosidase